jgi:hypothetical protein
VAGVRIFAAIPRRNDHSSDHRLPSSPFRGLAPGIQWGTRGVRGICMSMWRGTTIDGTRHNRCGDDFMSSPPPKDSRLETLNLNEDACQCLANSCGDWNRTPADQRERTCRYCPRNSNWVLKCIFKSCGVTFGGPKPYGWGSNTGKCEEWGCRYYPDGFNPPRPIEYCAKYKECPDGFNVEGERL